MTDKTTRVRILVAVDCKGNWVSAGYCGDRTGPHDWIAIDDLDTNMTFCWVEADVPVPQEAIVEGAVITDGKP